MLEIPHNACGSVGNAEECLWTGQRPQCMPLNPALWCIGRALAVPSSLINAHGASLSGGKLAVLPQQQLAWKPCQSGRHMLMFLGRGDEGPSMVTTHSGSVLPTIDP